MRFSKPLIISGALITAGVGGLVATQAVSAASDTFGPQGLVDKIATTFNLDKAKVQQVFDEERQAHMTDRYQKFEERLKQAVSDGKISQDLANQLQAKHKELQAYAESIKDKSEAERLELMKAKMNEMKQWAEDNNIARDLLGGHVRSLGGHLKPDVQ